MQDSAGLRSAAASTFNSSGGTRKSPFPEINSGKGMAATTRESLKRHIENKHPGTGLSKISDATPESRKHSSSVPRTNNLASFPAPRLLSERFLQFIKKAICRVQVFCRKSNFLNEFTKALSRGNSSQLHGDVPIRLVTSLTHFLNIASPNDKKKMIAELCRKLNNAEPNELDSILNVIQEIIEFEDGVQVEKRGVGEDDISRPMYVIFEFDEHRKSVVLPFFADLSDAVLGCVIEINSIDLVGKTYCAIQNIEVERGKELPKSVSVDCEKLNPFFKKANNLLLRSMLLTEPKEADPCRLLEQKKENFIASFMKQSKTIIADMELVYGCMTVERSELLTAQLKCLLNSLMSDADPSLLDRLKKESLKLQIKGAVKDLESCKMDFDGELMAAKNFYREVALLEEWANESGYSTDLIMQGVEECLANNEILISELAFHKALGKPIGDKLSTNKNFDESPLIKSFMADHEMIYAASAENSSSLISPLLDRYFTQCVEGGEILNVRKLRSKLISLETQLDNNEIDVLVGLVEKKIQETKVPLEEKTLQADPDLESYSGPKGEVRRYKSIKALLDALARKTHDAVESYVPTSLDADSKRE